MYKFFDLIISNFKYFLIKLNFILFEYIFSCSFSTEEMLDIIIH